MFSPDDLNELLSNSTHGSQDGTDSALRAKVLARTTAVIRTRRRMKRAGAVAALAGCYLAGVLTMSALRAPAAPISAAPGGLTAENTVHGDSNTAPPVTRPLVRPEDDGVIPSSGPAARTVAKFSPYDRLRRTGDRQLEDDNDVAAAARTYRRALKLASPTERDIVLDKDTWLLMAMKNNQTDKFAEDFQ